MNRSTRALAASALAAGLTALTAPAQAQVPSLPPTPPRDQWFAQNDTGHWSDGTRVRIDESCTDLPESERSACSLEAFKNKPFVVIAFVDSGINPYHQDFRAPEFTHHPSQYIEGFPDTAEEVPLSVGVADSEGYDAARSEDEDTLFDLARDRLYWFPGTRIIGGYSTGNGGTGSGRTDFKVIDEQSHGTGVASVAAGQFYGSNPNALIVMVEGLGDAGLNWATSQPWIDIVSNSWGYVGNLPLGSTTGTLAGTRRGQTVAFAAGNGATNTNSSTAFPSDGPIEDPCKCKTPDSNPSFTSQYGASWILNVGAISPINGQAHWWHSIPVDVSSFGSKWRAAGAFGVTREDNRDFGGTSCATPTTAGVLSSYIERARMEFNDTIGGQRPGQAVAVLSEGGIAPTTGPLADGTLTRLEGEEIVQKTAFPVAADPEKITWDYAVRPTTPTYFMYQGYGVVDRNAKALGLKVLMGEEPMPVRTEVDTWQDQVDAVRNALWGNP
jgi:hypothetical protein